MEISRDGLDSLQVQVVAILLSTVLLGIYTFCAGYSAQILMSRGLTSSRRKLLSIIATMYLATLSSWIAMTVGLFQSFSAVNSGLLPLSSMADCAGTIALTFNVFLGDGIVWWRVWILWNRNRWILLASCIMVLATLTTGSLDSGDSCGTGRFPKIKLSLASTNGTFFQFDGFGLLTVGLSLFSNIAATLLVVYKAWEHRRDTKTYLARVRSTTRVQRTLLLLVESGFVYWLIWILVLLSQILEGTTFSNGMVYFTEGCLIALVGIYPTVIIVLVALDKSEIEKKSQLYSKDRDVV